MDLLLTSGLSLLLAYRVKCRREQLEQCRCITFDLDDTIWKCQPVIERAVDAFYTFLQQNFPAIIKLYPTKKEWRTMSAQIQQENPDKKHDLTAVRKMCLMRAATEAQLDPSVVVDCCHRAFLVERNNVMDHLLPGALDVLQALKSQGIQLGALSNGNAVVQEIPILCDLFDFAVNPETAGAAKPSLKPFFQGLSLSCAISPSQMIHVGDSLRSDVVPAKQFGCRAIWVKTGSVWSGTSATMQTAETTKDNVKADVELESLLELPEILRQWGVLK